MNEPPPTERLHHGRAYRLREFSRRLAEKCDDDEVSFMAGAIAFNLVLALFPLLVLGVGIAGYVLSGIGDPIGAMNRLVAQNIPQGANPNLSELVETITGGIVERRASFTIVGAVFLLWFATRLSASLRVAMREIFDVGVKRNPVVGKAFDVVAVIVGVLLLALNLGATVVLTAGLQYGISVFGLGGTTLSLAERLLGFGVSFVSIWTLMLLVFRTMPARPIPWRTAAVGATFASVGHESLKLAFSWYATDIASYGSTFGNLATAAVLYLWIYYESLVFILSGEVAQVHAMRRASRVGVASFGSET